MTLELLRFLDNSTNTIKKKLAKRIRRNKKKDWKHRKHWRFGDLAFLRWRLHTWVLLSRTLPKYSTLGLPVSSVWKVRWQHTAPPPAFSAPGFSYLYIYFLHILIMSLKQIPRHLYLIKVPFSPLQQLVQCIPFRKDQSSTCYHAEEWHNDCMSSYCFQCACQECPCNLVT